MGAGDCIVLVHGTWGSNSPWTQEHSGLVRHLRGMQPPFLQIERFEWSGRNCHKERRAAAKRLGVWLRSPEMSQYNQIHLIGHSHGGNVALAAATVSRRRVASIVTLGTPFIIAKARENYLSEDPIRLVMIPLCYVVLVPSLVLLLRFLNFSPGEDWSTRALGSILVWLALLGPFFVADWASRPLSHILDRMFSPKTRRRYRAFASATAPTLCIFDRQDEAQRAIKLSLIASSRLKLAAWIAVWLCGCIQLLVILGALIGWLWYPPILEWGSVTSESVWFVPLVALLIGFWSATGLSLLILVAGGTTTALFSAFSLGWKSAADLLYMQLRISDVPKFGQVHVYRVSNQTKRSLLDFRHTRLCQNDEVIGVVVRWLATHQRADSA